MISKDTAEKLFNSLDYKEKKIVFGALNKTRHSYLMSGMDVDIPYFFVSTNPVLFEGVDTEEFLAIEDSYQFGVEVVYYISKYIIENRRD